MRTIRAREIKRRSIGAVDEAVRDGPVHVIRSDEPRYVIMTEEHYQELVEGYHEAYVARAKSALEDARAGRVRNVTADQLIAEMDLED